jgi:hypothetical protein
MSAKLQLDNALIAKMYEDGMSCARIAKEFGVCAEIIRRRAHEVLGCCRSPLSAEARQIISDSRKGKLHHNWKGGRYIDYGGYILMTICEHPNANGHNRVFEHRLVMEEFLGRYLTSDEMVHHIDGDKANNCIENLFLFPSNSSHTSYHNTITKLRKQHAITKQEAMLMLSPADFMATLGK